MAEFLEFASENWYLFVALGVVLGWLILNERMDWSVILATAVVLLGVVLVKSSRS